MVDEKLDDQVWVTVVATGYGDARGRGRSAARSRSPRASRASSAARAASAPAPRSRRPRPRAVDELDVPEFLPTAAEPADALAPTQPRMRAHDDRRHRAPPGIR